MYSSRDYYLQFENQIIGLHFVGVEGPDTYTSIDENGQAKEVTCQFRVHEAFGNFYNQEGKMIGRGSFRLQAVDDKDIDQLVNDFLLDGYQIIMRPGVIAQDAIEYEIHEN